MKRHAIRVGALCAILVAAFVNAACLVKETSATICLEPDGSGRWTVLARNIHATGDTPADRQQEEEAFMAAVAAGQHSDALAFRALGGADVRTHVVSANWPYAVATEATFPDIARVCQQVLDRIGEVRGRVTLERKDNRTTLRMTLDYDPDAVADSQPDSETNDEVNLFGDDGPVFFMRHGQFVDAVGFDIADDGRVAKLKQDDRDWNKDPHMVLSLTWVATEAVAAARK